MIRRRFTVALAAASLFSTLIVSPATAADLVFNFNHVFSSSGLPTGVAPWLRAEFTNIDATTVDLTITALFQGNTAEFIGKDGVFFNLDPVKDAATLSFLSTGGQAYDSILTGTDAFKADGDGKYDINILFTNSGDGRLTDGEFSTIRISGAQAGDFDYLSAPDGGSGPFLAAAHVQGTGTGGGSAWIAPNAVPEPAFYQLGTLLGLGGLALWRRRRARK